MDRKLRYGMVGGSLSAFIGDVHRKAVYFGENAVLEAGCFSRDERKNRETAEKYALDASRVYADVKSMAEAETAREDGIDFVTIVTPNDAHYEAVKAFLTHGIAVFCEKPLTFTVEEAEELVALSKAHNTLFAMNYSYTGNVMVKEARELVRRGMIGDLINVNAEYFQEYLMDDLTGEEPADSSLASWRKDPARSGGSNCVGDIGSHVENTVSYITGQKLKRVIAVMDRFGRPLETNANILVEFECGAHGVFTCSQVTAGYANGLKVRIFGTKGAIEWEEETPETLKLTLKDQPTQILKRGLPYILPEAAKYSRLPSGHPEGVYEAFANMYADFTAAVAKVKDGEPLTASDLDFPQGEDGLAGVRFIQACLKSDRDGGVWVEV